MSKPSLITNPAIVDKLIVGFSSGFSLRDCAELAGISERCLKNWIAIAKKAIEKTELDGGKKEVSVKNSPYVTLYLQLRNARAVGKVENINIIQEVARGGYVARKTETTEIFIAAPAKKGRKSKYEEDGDTADLILVEKRKKVVEEVLPPNYRAAEIMLRATGWGEPEVESVDEKEDGESLADWIKQADKRSAEGWRTLNMFGNVMDEGDEDADANEETD